MFYAAILLLFFVPQNDSLSLSGTVFDPNAKPAANIQVHLAEPTARQQWTRRRRRMGLSASIDLPLEPIASRYAAKVISSLLPKYDSNRARPWNSRWLPP